MVVVSVQDIKNKLKTCMLLIVSGIVNPTMYPEIAKQKVIPAFAVMSVILCTLSSHPSLSCRARNHDTVPLTVEALF